MFEIVSNSKFDIMFVVILRCVCYFVEFRLALIQLAVSASKTDNLQRAAKLVTEAAKQGAKIVSLPVGIHILTLNPLNWII